MSGYLARMLRAAVRSERRLHPMAGSIYGERDAAPKSSFTTDLAELYGTAEDQHPAGSEHTLASYGAAAPITMRQAAEPMAFFEQYEPLQPPGRKHEAQTARTAELSSSARTDWAGLHQHERATTTSGERLAATPRIDERNDVEGDAAQVRGQAVLRKSPSKTTVVRANGAAGEASARERALPSPPMFATELQARAATRRENWPRREATPQTRTNEPQAEVHIGRIEVLAVQPPTPAPAPRRERTTSLADYLAGRSGRAR